MQRKIIKIGNKLIGENQPVFIIAEAGVNHNGRLDLALKLIDAASNAGADAVKFQTFKAEDVAVPAAKMAGYQKKNIGKTESQFAMLKKLELEGKFYKPIIERCKKRKIIFLSTPHGGFKSVDFLQSLGVPAFKFGSGDLTNLPVLEYAAKFKKPMILSTGMATLSEVEEAVKYVRKAGNRKIIVLHCTTNYPCTSEDVNLKAMQTITKKLGVLSGLSDHTLGIQVPIMATTLGASMIEKHFTLGRNMAGPDHKASVNPAELKIIVEAVRNTEKILGNGVKKPTPKELIIRAAVRKSIVSLKNIRKGEKFTKENIGIKRPGTGLEPKFFKKIIGLTAIKNLKKDSILNWSDFSRKAKTPMDLSYKETLKDLSTRINVHKKFSQLEINDWILSLARPKSGEKVLDMGCGDGKQVIAFAKAVGKKGKVFGADVNKELLKKAKETTGKEKLKAFFEVQDFDKKFRWRDSSFDLISCCFAIYYAKNSEKNLLEIKRVLKNKGRLFICGPTENNAVELNKIHEKIVGKKVPQTAITRAKRIKKEILPLIKKYFNNIKVEIFKNKISFPTAKSFIDYYSSTLLFKESVPDDNKEAVLKKMENEVKKIINTKKCFNINKEIIGIAAYK